MRSLLIASLVILSSHVSFGRNISFFAGGNTNHFYGSIKEGGGYDTGTSSHSPGLGFSSGIAVDSVDGNKLKLRASLRLDYYTGGVSATHSDKFSTTRTDFDIQKLTITGRVMPFSFYLKNGLTFNLGIQYSVLVHESFNGTYRKATTITTPPYGTGIDEYNVEDEVIDFSHQSSFGAAVRAAYEHKITSRLTLVTEYSLYASFTREFLRFPTGTKTIQNFLGIGLKRTFANKKKAQTEV